MENNKFPVKILLHKKGEMIYFSQLDVYRLTERALRRSGLPLYFTQGFNPHPKISFLSGLKVGQEGKIESILYFKEPISFTRLKTDLLPQLPLGLEISSCVE
jgi:radical SAM-linked protein